MTGEKVLLGKLDFQKATNQIKSTAIWTFRGVPFLFADYLKITMKKIISNSAIWSNINLHRGLIPLIAHNVIAPCHRQRLEKILKGREPALLADESTDFRKTKALALMTRYFDAHEKRIRNSLLGLIPLYDSDEYSKADHMTIALKIKGSMKKIGCTMENFSFIGTDGAVVYRGADNLVIRLVQGWNGYMRDMNCACHVQQLCTECAVGKLPYEVQKSPNKVANYFAHDHVTSVGPERVDPKDSQHWRKEGISLDTEVIRQQRLLSKANRDTFLKVSRSFLVELCDRYRGKFDFKKDFLIQIKAPHPQNALSTTFHGQVKDLNKLDGELPAILSGDLDRSQTFNNEWKDLVIKDVPESYKDEKHTDVFCVEISELKDGTENFMFQTVADFALDCLCVPN
ncbi:hypothetical protein QAD02_007978 [Eretmocerus hayati]|uniref:Uncharacterized protein n=1 Tax=Eretmocerus hayati TaxID=131215 RepID=A0ACC2N5Z5_9HYME|nr:hypothetical protein QAD02_007978 [Eretmocerus hayati]